MMLIRPKFTPGRGTVVAAVACIAFIGADIANVHAAPPVTCSKTTVTVDVPRTHLIGIDSVVSVFERPPALRDVIAEKVPDVAVGDVVRSNPSLKLTTMGDLPRSYAGKICLAKPARMSAVANVVAEATPDDESSSAPKNLAVKDLEGKDVLNDAELGTVLWNQGFRGASFINGFATVLGESNARTHARLTNKNGTTDRGMWQINDGAHGEVPTDTCDNPVRATAEAWRISSHGRSFGQWMAYQHRARNPRWPSFIARATLVYGRLKLS